MSKKAAFTMVELIFVIVILGILAAVAVPRLNASREDAQIAAIVADMRAIYDDIHTYYAVNGEIASGTPLNQITSIKLINGHSSDASYSLDGVNPCLVFRTYVTNCVVIDYPFGFVGDGLCAKAVKKAEFLRGRQSWKNYLNKCDEAVKATDVVHIKDSLTNRSRWRGISLFLGENGIEWE